MLCSGFAPRFVRSLVLLALPCVLERGALAQTALCARQKLVASDGAAGDFFSTLALSGDTALIGASYADAPQMDSGAAYVWVKQGGTWVQQAKLTPSDGGDSALFGSGVALLGDTAVVGAMLADAPVAGSGAAYVFERSVGIWTQTTKLQPPDADQQGKFGRSVSISGDTIAIGASDASGAGPGSGAVYVFVRSGATWALQAKLVGVGTQNTAEFGWSVALDGDTLVAGDHGAVSSPFPGGGPSRGAAYVFRRTGLTWTRVADLASDVLSGNDDFGSAVAIAGDTVVVGDPAGTVPGADVGAAFVYRESGGAWPLEKKLFQPVGDSTGSDLYGWAVAIRGERLIVSAPFYEVHPTGDSGVVYVYDRTGTSWHWSASLYTPEPAGSPPSFRFFGSDLALDAVHVLVGAFLDGTLGGAAGAVYSFGPSAHVRFCFGDGSLPTPCPCAAPNTVPNPSGAPDAGCATALNLDGGRLSACGGVAPDRVRFLAELRHGFASFANLVKGNADQAGGTMSGDGLRCVDGQLIRFGGHIAGTNGDAYGVWSYPNAAQTISVSAATLQIAGQTAYYQLVFRAAQPGFCNPSTYNITNAVEVAW